eukprot:scaffold24170_cov102-Isochrysis_galbana.AAC.3
MGTAASGAAAAVLRKSSQIWSNLGPREGAAVMARPAASAASAASPARSVHSSATPSRYDSSCAVSGGTVPVGAADTRPVAALASARASLLRFRRRSAATRSRAMSSRSGRGHPSSANALPNASAALGRSAASHASVPRRRQPCRVVSGSGGGGGGAALVVSSRSSGSSCSCDSAKISRRHLDGLQPPLGLQPGPAAAAALTGRRTLDCLGAASHVGAVRLLGSSPWADRLAVRKAADCGVAVAGRRGAWLGRLGVEADAPRPAGGLRVGLCGVDRLPLQFEPSTCEQQY